MANENPPQRWNRNYLINREKKNPSPQIESSSSNHQDDFDPYHVPWWHEKKYRYNERDVITYQKVRPGTKLKKMNCQHILTMASFKELRKNITGHNYRQMKNPGKIPCPVCQKPIPLDDLPNQSKKK